MTTKEFQDLPQNEKAILIAKDVIAQINKEVYIVLKLEDMGRRR